MNCPECDRPMHTRVCACGYLLPYQEPAAVPAAPISRGQGWRERWYRERNLPYEPPKLGSLQKWNCVGGSIGMPARSRQDSITDVLPDEVNHEAVDAW